MRAVFPSSSLYSILNTHRNLSLATPTSNLDPQYMNRSPYIPLEYTHAGCLVSHACGVPGFSALDATTPSRRRAIPRHTMFTVQVPQYTGLRATRVTKVRTTRRDSTTRAARRRGGGRARAAADGTMTDIDRRLAWREVEGFEMCIRAYGARGGGAARVMTRGDGVKYFVRA